MKPAPAPPPFFVTSFVTSVAGALPGEYVDGRHAQAEGREQLMAEHPNVGRVRDAYAAFARADLDNALKDLADDCVFHFGGHGPNSGDHQGRAAIEQALIHNFTLTGGTQTLDIKAIFANDQHATVVLHESASRPDGATLAIDEVHVLAIDSYGKITNLWDLPADAEVHDRFFDGE